MAHSKLTSRERKARAVIVFWKKVDKSGGCWIWTGAKTGRGYGVIRADYVTHLAHRYSYHLAFGEIPEGLHVCHHCDNPPCVNPEHLFLGTSKDNMQDAKMKGRTTLGEKNGRSKLTEEDVLEIIRLKIVDGMKSVDIAQSYGIGRTYVDIIVRGERWSHLERERNGNQ